MPHTHVMLRPATPGDAPRAATLLIETRRAFMPYAPSAHSEAELREWVAGVLVPSGGVMVAEVHGEVVGVMATAQSEQGSWIGQMAVHPALVNQGIGTLLLAQAMRALTLPIRLYTFQANAGARRFYERHGFVPIAFTDGQANEERCPDVLYELQAIRAEAPATSPLVEISPSSSLAPAPMSPPDPPPSPRSSTRLH